MAYDALYDLEKIPNQQDKATLISTDMSIFQLIPRSKVLQIPNEDLIYLAKQLFGKLDERDKLLMQRKISKQGISLRSIENNGVSVPCMLHQLD